MSTCNFNLQCASKYYVLSSTIEEENEQGEIEIINKESWNWDDDIDYILEIAKEKGYYKYIPGRYEARPMDNNICCKDECFNDDYIYCYIGLNSGYYKGATIDYDLCFGDYGWLSEYKTVDDFVQDVVENILEEKSDYGNWNKGLCAMQRPNLYKKLSGIIFELIDELETICNHCCDERLVRIGIFSNGEAIYATVDSLKEKLICVA